MKSLSESILVGRDRSIDNSIKNLPITKELFYQRVAKAFKKSVGEKNILDDEPQELYKDIYFLSLNATSKTYRRILNLMRKNFEKEAVEAGLQLIQDTYKAETHLHGWGRGDGQKAADWSVQFSNEGDGYMKINFRNPDNDYGDRHNDGFWIRPVVRRSDTSLRLEDGSYQLSIQGPKEFIQEIIKAK